MFELLNMEFSREERDQMSDISDRVVDSFDYLLHESVKIRSDIGKCSTVNFDIICSASSSVSRFVPQSAAQSAERFAA